MILSVRRSSETSVLPGRFQLHGLEVEVEPADAGGWDARVVAPVAHAQWHHGRHAWDAIDAAAFAHLAAAGPDETYRRLGGALAEEAAAHADQLVAA
jgi:hypothetical protein